MVLVRAKGKEFPGDLLGVGSPPCQEQGKTNSLEDTGKSTNGNGIKRSLLSEDLCDELQLISIRHNRTKVEEHTEGAELAKKIKDPKYAAPLYERVPVALIKAPTPYD